MTHIVLPRRSLGAVAASGDFKEEVLKQVGDLGDVDIMFNMVLVACYVRPEKTSGGIYLTQTSQEEDVYQGKVGLVLKLGPNAFESDDEFDFKGQGAQIGEWVVYKVGDAWQLQVGQWPCRLVRDSAIRMKVKDPQKVI